MRGDGGQGGGQAAEGPLRRLGGRVRSVVGLRESGYLPRGLVPERGTQVGGAAGRTQANCARGQISER